jgi:hypothetical protein
MEETAPSLISQAWKVQPIPGLFLRDCDPMGREGPRGLFNLFNFAHIVS